MSAEGIDLCTFTKNRLPVQVRYDRTACDAWFQCTEEWDEFEMNLAEGKADLAGAEADEDGLFVREVPEDAEELAKAAAESCPVDAITIIEDGEQTIPE